MQALIECSNLRKEFSDTVALSNLSLSVLPGQIIGLLGPNGAGKTTAIHIFLGLLSPTSGQVRVLNKNPLKERHFISSKLNFSSAYAQLPSNLKVSENMNIFARLYGVKRPKNKIEMLLEMFEISQLKNRLTGALSSGQKTRLNLAKCLLNDPKLLLLDEPTASLDPEMADTTRQVLKTIQKETNVGILYTSHNMPEIEELCHKIYFIHEGKMIASGTPKEVMLSFESKNLDQVFIKIVRSGDFVIKKS